MNRKFTAKIVTANELLSGEVVYLRADTSWSPDHGEAEYLTDSTTADARLLAAEACGDLIVSPYLADAQVNLIGRPEPVLYREALRTRGPSNKFHGKQAATIEQVL